MIPDTDSRALLLSVLVDDPTSWIVPWAEKLVETLSQKHRTVLLHDSSAVPYGDVCFLLGCTKIVPESMLKRNQNNIVVHESNLPKGRGFSPVAWQVLTGANRIPVTLLEAITEPDAGPVWLCGEIVIDGTELMPEIRHKQGKKTLEMCLEYVRIREHLTPKPQTGSASVFRRRTRKDDRLDPEKTIAEQFDHLRIVDNERYPAWFSMRGRNYRLTIAPMDEEKKHASS